MNRKNVRKRQNKLRKQKESENRNMFLTNVVKSTWKVVTKERNGFRAKEYLIQAESEEKARMSIPATEEVVSAKKMDGGDTV